MNRKVVSIITIVIVSVGFILFFYLNTDKSEPTDEQLTPTQSPGSIELLPLETENDPRKTPPYQVTNETIIIDTQTVVVYRPTDTQNLSSLIVYSHGSNEHVTPTIEPESFAEALPIYGEYFSSQGALFVASEMFGENWGSSQAQGHILILINDLKELYPQIDKVYLYGFSMGGLPTLRTIKRSPNVVDKVALLAPTIAIEDWTPTSLQNISNIPVYIWHGTDDVNVPIVGTREFISVATDQQLTNITLEEIPDETHRHFLPPEKIWQFFTTP